MDESEVLKFTASYLVLQNGKELLSLLSINSMGMMYLLDPVTVNKDNTVERTFRWTKNRVITINPDAVIAVLPPDEFAQDLYIHNRKLIYGDEELPRAVEANGDPIVPEQSDIPEPMSKKLH